MIKAGYENLWPEGNSLEAVKSGCLGSEFSLLCNAFQFFVSSYNLTQSVLVFFASGTLPNQRMMPKAKHRISTSVII